MSDTQTDLRPVTKVRDISSDEGVFNEGTVNVLWQDADGRYYTSSWDKGDTEQDPDWVANTLAWESDETGLPKDTSWFFQDDALFVNGDEPDHAGALAKLGLVPMEDAEAA